MLTSDLATQRMAGELPTPINALDCFTSMVRDQKVNHFVPVGGGRRLQRMEDTNLI